MEKYHSYIWLEYACFVSDIGHSEIGPTVTTVNHTEGKGYIFDFLSYFNFTPKNLGSQQNLGIDQRFIQAMQF